MGRDPPGNKAPKSVVEQTLADMRENCRGGAFYGKRASPNRKRPEANVRVTHIEFGWRRCWRSMAVTSGVQYAPVMANH